MSTTPPRHSLRVILAKQREHLPRIIELEQKASADRRRVYEGVPWTVGGFREYLRAGSALVVLTPQNNVVGYACYSLSLLGVDVAKLVVTYPAAEEALLASLYDVMNRMKKQFVNVPMILELGTANV